MPQLTLAHTQTRTYRALSLQLTHNTDYLDY